MSPASLLSAIADTEPVLLHCVNLIHPRRPGARQHDVDLVVVAARSAEEATRRVAACEFDSDARVLYRNVFDPNELITWARQRWDRAESEGTGAPVRAYGPHNPDLTRF